MEGGFQAWTAAGLRSKAEGMENPISNLKEVTDHMLEMRLFLFWSYMMLTLASVSSAWR